MSLRFHWMLPKPGEVAAATTPGEAARYRLDAIHGAAPAARRDDMEGWLHFARRAEEAGIDSTLIAFNRYEPDPFLVSCALGASAKRLKFIAACRSGLMQPTSFVQQVNTLSALVDGRIAVNIVAGSSLAEQRSYGDFLAHDERYARTEEFLSVCNAFWRNGAEVDFDGKYYRVEKGKINTPFVSPERSAPEIYVSGHSEQAERLILGQGTCWLRGADAPQTLQAGVARMRAHGIDVCVRMNVICRPTRDEAMDVAYSLLPADKRDSIVAVKDDSRMYAEADAHANDPWLTRSLWAGLVPHHGPSWTVLLGTPQELAGAFLAYGEIGVNEFMLSGWPEVDELVRFGEDVLPLIREGERRQVA